MLKHEKTLSECHINAGFRYSSNKHYNVVERSRKGPNNCWLNFFFKKVNDKLCDTLHLAVFSHFNNKASKRHKFKYW